MSSLFFGRRGEQRVGPIDLATTKRICNIFAQRSGIWNSQVVMPNQAPPPLLESHVFAPPTNRNSFAEHDFPGKYGPSSRGNFIPGSAPVGPPATMYKPPFQFVDTVFVGSVFNGDNFQFRKRYEIDLKIMFFF